MKKFALIGVSGFVAPRHLQAIKETGNDLVAAMDRSDSAGILDHYFPGADFFLDLEGLGRFLETYRKEQNGIDYLTVCSPNYLHDTHVRFGLKQQASVICEKPLVIDPSALEQLYRFRQESGQEVFNILQLRLHPQIIELKERVDRAAGHAKFEIDLAYITPRGKWYHSSWKGDPNKSGGITTNIGIHFFDMLLWIFGPVQQVVVHEHNSERAAGYLELEKARVRWFLSINEADLPAGKKQGNGHAFRLVTVDGADLDFSSGFNDLHRKSYEKILDGKGFPLMEALPSIELVHRIRNQAPVGKKGDLHPMAK